MAIGDDSDAVSGAADPAAILTLLSEDDGTVGRQIVARRCFRRQQGGRLELDGQRRRGVAVVAAARRHSLLKKSRWSKPASVAVGHLLGLRDLLQLSVIELFGFPPETDSREMEISQMLQLPFSF